MYSSPTTPGGTGRSHESNMNSAPPATGLPIGTSGPGASGALTEAYTVASVGP
nr:hypothetical protein CPGR_06020 [Mycolicibacterium fortuitum subsp. fortuitum DSM 46621 = ATCC 6841 = JCM 6387]CRL82845.1 hypothetical protein CPGR_06072 [Mycolicibacter nonchromogenicus]